MFCDFPKYKHLKQTIFRGPGGGGNATSDSEVNILTTLTNQALAYSEQAGLEADAAAASAASASGSALAASTSAANAATSASTASTQASTATTQASNAASSASAASTSATSASTQASNAALSASSASTSASTATTQAGNASTSASAASTSASTASTQASNAASSASTASTSATNASNSAAAASGSASTASTQATNASNSASAASTSASNASTSATNAANSASEAAASAASINDANLVHKTGNETIGGIKTFSSTVVGSVSGNAATVTTNANLTGAVTSAGNATTLSNAVVTSAKLSADLQAATYGMKNRIINGNFGINQRGVSGTVVLAAGVYGHDRFKAGASGCTYTFATSANVTTLTISAGSLVQVVEGLNLQSGTYTLSWTGTAQGKINGGSYAGSGLTGTATGGTNLTVEFSTGSLSFAQLEKGSTATSFDFRDYGRELIMCQRYFHQQDGLLYLQIGSFLWDGQVNCSFNYQLPVTMRSVPTFAKSGNFTSTSYGSPNVAGMTIDASASTTKTVSLVCITGTGGTAGYSTYIRSVADTSALFSFSAEL